MNARYLLLALSVSLAAAQAPDGPSLRGTVTDPSGAAVPGAQVEIRGPIRVRRARTDQAGEYRFANLTAGKYQIRISAKGFSVTDKTDLLIDHDSVFNSQLAIQVAKHSITVGDQTGAVRPDPASNGGAVILRGRQIAALSDDPDELALQLQALAGPAPGPDGGQTYIDGFTGGNLPPKSSIREVRVNANPFSPEYDRPGFGRIEVFTKPGTETFHGQAFAQYNNQTLNSRNPLLAQSDRPPFRAQLYGVNLTGPLLKNKASFTLDAEHRQIDENAFILATTLDSNLNPVTINQALAAPQTWTSFSPRLDYTLSQKNTLTARFQAVWIGLDNQGAGDFNLASRAYNQRQSEQTAQLTETFVLSPQALDETRFQYQRTTSYATAQNSAPALDVQGAFFGGGASVGDSATITNNWELTNIATAIKGRHTWKWGGRIRHSRLADTSENNFAGTYTFYSLAGYQETLALQQAGESGAQIFQLGYGPDQYSRNAGIAASVISQTDAGLFLGDDWRALSNLTLSFGIRYEAQTNIGDHSDWSPRLGIAWGLDGGKSHPAKTIVRAGFGTFYDRIPTSVILNALRYNGLTQQSYLVLNPTFFPSVPPLSQLPLDQQQLRPFEAGIRAPRLYQTNLGIERQLGAGSRIAVTWTGSRGVHLLDVRNINTPIGGVYPFGDRSIRLLTESAGLSNQNQLITSVNINSKRLVLFGFYSLSYGMDDNEGLPANPYNLRAEWGPSSYGDLRNRVVIGTTVPLPAKFSVSPFLAANSGQPYNITTGLDPEQTGFPAARPALLPGVGTSACQGNSLVYAAAFGCFNLNPAAGTPVIGRNYARGPADVNLVLRLARTWAFGRESAAVPAAHAPAGHEGGPPAAMFQTATGRRYNVTLSASTLNALNHANFASPDGDLSSPYFGQSRSLGGLIVMAHGGALSTYNRKIDLQLRFSW